MTTERRPRQDALQDHQQLAKEKIGAAGNVTLAGLASSYRLT